MDLEPIYCAEQVWWWHAGEGGLAACRMQH